MENKYSGGEPKEEERTFELSPLAVAILANATRSASNLAGLKEEPEDWRERASTWRPTLSHNFTKAELMPDIPVFDVDAGHFIDHPHPLPLSKGGKDE